MLIMTPGVYFLIASTKSYFGSNSNVLSNRFARIASSTSPGTGGTNKWCADASWSCDASCSGGETNTEPSWERNPPGPGRISPSTSSGPGSAPVTTNRRKIFKLGLIARGSRKVTIKPCSFPTSCPLASWPCTKARRNSSNSNCEVGALYGEVSCVTTGDPSFLTPVTASSACVALARHPLAGLFSLGTSVCSLNPTLTWIISVRLQFSVTFPTAFAELTPKTNRTRDGVGAPKCLHSREVVHADPISPSSRFP
mmetsp:Transcript_9823/g.36505  ORF Transcript_9823/g.36505 Transcript_9823/m.36505 type:complete len:254 (-) Transcript_9823:346-1107(-)